MKKIFFWMVLIVGIVTLIGSCAKKEETESTASTASTASTVTSCSETASGTITGIDNMSISGSYSLMLNYGEMSGIDNTTGCVSNASLLSAFSASISTDAQSFNYWRIVTSSTSFAHVWKSYTDTSCSTEAASFVIGDTNLTIVDNVTGLTSGTYSMGTTGTKVTTTQSCVKGKGSTEDGVTWLKGFGSMDVTLGEEKIGSGSGSTYYYLMHADNSTKRPNSSNTGATNYTGKVWRSRGSSDAQPTDWTDDGAQDAFQNY